MGFEVIEMIMMNDTSIYLRALMVAEQVYLFEDCVGINRVHGENITNSMSIPFILDNLNEKVWVYDHSGLEGREPFSFDWLCWQIMVTIRSYLVNNRVGRTALILIKRAPDGISFFACCARFARTVMNIN